MPLPVTNLRKRRLYHVPLIFDPCQLGCQLVILYEPARILPLVAPALGIQVGGHALKVFHAFVGVPELAALLFYALVYPA